MQRPPSALARARRGVALEGSNMENFSLRAQSTRVPGPPGIRFAFTARRRLSTTSAILGG
jgi:hypothetical protein